MVLPALVMAIFYIIKKNVEHPYGKPKQIAQYVQACEDRKEEIEKLERQNQIRVEAWELWMAMCEKEKREKELAAAHKEARVVNNMKIVGYLMAQKFLPVPDAPALDEIQEDAEEEERLQEEERLEKEEEYEDNELTMEGKYKKHKFKSGFDRHNFKRPDYLADYEIIIDPLGRKIIKPKAGYVYKYDIKEKPPGSESIDISKRSTKRSF